MDHLSVTQCNKCNKIGHIAKYCRAENETSAMPATHPNPALTTTIFHYQRSKYEDQKLFKCSNHRKYQHGAFYHGSMEKSNCPFYKEQCLRLNLQDNRTASAALPQVILDLNVDILFIQEPYTTKKLVPNIPFGYSVRHALDNDALYGAILIIKNNLCSS